MTTNMTKLYQIEKGSPSLYEKFLHEAPLSNSATNFTIQFRNGKFSLNDTIESAQVLRDWLLERPNTRSVAPFEEHIYNVNKHGLQWLKRQRNIPGYIDEHFRQKYEREIWGGAPQWITTKARNILPKEYRNIIKNLTLPGWEVQDAEIIIQQNYRISQRLRFGLNQNGIELVCIRKDDTLENWVEHIAKEYNTELIQKETEDIIVELPTNAVYRSIPGRTYAQGVQTLREAYQRGEHLLDRPLTFSENLIVRLENQKLFSDWLWSCTGIAYKAGSSKFKIIHKCNQLIDIDSNMYQSSIPVNYDSLEGDNVIELDRNDATYNELLSRDQVLKHPAWQAVVEDDTLLQDYTTEVFRRLNKSDAMGFRLKDDIETDQLRPLIIVNIGYFSNANGYNFLKFNSRFVQVTLS
jgi:hypothetical protein